MKIIPLLVFLLNFYYSKADRNNQTKRQIHFVARRQDPLSRGPVLFPSSPSPPPNNPLIVTSRPLSDQISRSGLVLSTKSPYWSQQDNEIALDDYEDPAPSPYRVVEPQYPTRRTNSSQHPYAAVATKLKQLLRTKDNRGYNSYERQTVLPPIYTALGNYAKSKILKGNPKYNKPILASPKKFKTVKSDGDDDEYYNDNYGNEAKPYAFSYAVKDHQTGDDFSHSQTQSGSATNGEYRVKLPDGRLQIVSYTADNGGYKAEVRYEEDGESQTQEEDPNKLGRIVVPSKEEADYEDYYYYDDKPKEVLITSKPTYYHTTPSPLQGLEHVRDYGEVRFAVSTTPAGAYGVSDRNLKSGQVRYTTVAPIEYTPRPLHLVNYFEYKK